MKQFVLAKSVVTTGEITSLTADKALGFVPKGANSFVANGSAIVGEFNIVVREGEYLNIIPAYKNKLTYTVSQPEAATKYSSTVAVPSGEYEKGTYTLIIAKKGTQINEKNKWTVSSYLNKKGAYADIIAAELVKQINALGFVSASYASNKITINGEEAGVDYKVIPADMLMGNAVVETNAKLGQNSANAMIDLYNKCAADRGINYTYKYTDIYPSMPFNPLKGADSADQGYILYTLRFAEPRITKTTDEVVNQVVHIAFPKGTTLTTFDGILNAIGTKVNAPDGGSATNMEEPVE